jgi:hypothetical protein
MTIVLVQRLVGNLTVGMSSPISTITEGVEAELCSFKIHMSNLDSLM